MKPKEKRDRLFKINRPNIRPMTLIRGSELSQDMSILWAAYRMGTFDLPELTQKDFTELMLDEVDPYEKKWLIEDYNVKYSDGYGPVGMICAVYNGWEIEPHFEPFKWASSRNILRAIVSFLQMMRYDRNIGIVNVHSLEDSKKFFNHIIEYGVLRFATKIPDGDIRGDRYIYYIRGRKHGRSNREHSKPGS